MTGAPEADKRRKNRCVLLIPLFRKKPARARPGPIPMPVRSNILVSKSCMLMRAAGVISATPLPGGGVCFRFADVGLSDPEAALDAPLLGGLTGRGLISSALSHVRRDPRIMAVSPRLICGTGLLDGDTLRLGDEGGPPTRPRLIIEWATGTWSHYGHVDVTSRATGAGSVSGFMAGFDLGAESLPRIDAARRKHEMFGVPFTLYHGALTPEGVRL